MNNKKNYDRRFTESFWLKPREDWPEEAKEYDPRLGSLGIQMAMSSDISPSQANTYISKIGNHKSRFEMHESIQILHIGIDLKYAEKYDKNFDWLHIKSFIDYGCPPEKANLYAKHSDYPNYGLAFLCRMNVSPDLKTYEDKSWRELVFKVQDVMMLVPKEEINKMSVIAITSNSILIKHDKCIWKYSKYQNKEIELIKKIKKANPNLKNVIGLEEEFIAELNARYPLPKSITGSNLEQIIAKNHLSEDKIIKYSSDIMNGLVEMRKAGIYYHRDIRPANILIDKENDRAIICDLGIATTEKHPKNEDDKKYTRHYGGKNDIISLGQVMYKMATGEHLFEKLNSGLCSGEIRENREKAYKNPIVFNEYMEKLDMTITNYKAKNLIKACLNAKNWDYGKMNKMFINAMKNYSK
jgi:hypothetical protein